MHTHFGSATHLVSTFLGVLIVGVFWRLTWLHAMSYGISRNSRHIVGFSKAALAQF